MKQSNKLTRSDGSTVKKPKVEAVSYDWKDSEGGLEQIQKALKAHGIHMQQSPMHEGTDTYGFHISNKKLSKKELKEADMKNFGPRPGSDAD